jgi:hypothetical protein
MNTDAANNLCLSKRAIVGYAYLDVSGNSFRIVQYWTATPTASAQAEKQQI